MKKITSIIVLAMFAFLIPTFLLLNDALHKAAYNGDIKLVKEILKTDVNLDDRDSFGGTSLHAAMFQDNMEIVKILIEAGHEINVQGTYNKYTPLHDAVWANNLEAAKILIEHGARLDMKGRDGLTPLEKALDEDKKELIKYLKSIK